LEGGGNIDYPWWAPTFWHGMGLRVWLGLLYEGGLRISPSRLGVVASVTLMSGFNSIARLITDLKYADRLRIATCPDDPIFIVGHWRSGTTVLHEFMMLDSRFSIPSTYQCFAPGHFLSTWGFTRRRLAQSLLPSRRPGDNVKAGWDRPQEDEFALLNLGAPSPYRRIAFPNEHSTKPQGLDLNSLSSRQREQWKRAMVDFVRRLRLKSTHRLVMKSPTHTARIATLLELFPRARFIHITRNPYAMIPSTKRLWQSLHTTQSLQSRLAVDLDSYVFSCFQEMQQAFNRDRFLLGTGQLHEVRYEDLVRDPMAAIRAVYTHLNLGDFSPMEQALERAMPEFRSYQTNTYQISGQLKEAIAAKCADYFHTYGYNLTTGEPLTSA